MFVGTDRAARLTWIVSPKRSSWARPLWLCRSEPPFCEPSARRQIVRTEPSPNLRPLSTPFFIAPTPPPLPPYRLTAFRLTALPPYRLTALPPYRLTALPPYLSSMPIATINPATGQTLRRSSRSRADQLDARLQRAADAYHRIAAPPSRIAPRLMLAGRRHPRRREGRVRAADGDRDGEAAQGGDRRSRQDAPGAAATTPNTPSGSSRDEEVKTTASRSYVTYQPIGPVLAIMPWNFPFWQVFRFAAPALMAGNVGLLKHASNVPQCALAIEDIFRRAGFPEGVFQTLLIETRARDARSSRIRASPPSRSPAATPRAARSPPRRARRSRRRCWSWAAAIRSSSCRAPTSTPPIATAVKARTSTTARSASPRSGSSSHEPIADEFERGLRRRNGRRSRSAIRWTRRHRHRPAGHRGQLAHDRRAGGSSGQRRRASAHRRTPARPAGATTTLRRCSPGITPSNRPAYREEVFGPVALLFRVRDIDDAIRLANDSPFGLGASVWTRERRGAGSGSSGRSKPAWCSSTRWWPPIPRVPFGGVKQSGYGRELSPLGIREFVNVKTVWMA